MNVDRGDKIGATRATGIIKGNESNDALPNETPEKADENTPSLTLSSERFKFSTFAEDPSIDYIDKAGSIPKGFRKEKPSLREALESMGYDEKTEELLKMFTDKTNGRLEEIEEPELNTEDVATIFCYTYEEDIDSPYRKLYAKGNEKTWWAFTSTSEDFEATKKFVKKNKGTLFTLSGEAWGYDISVFSNFPSKKEILLEPERRLSIKSVKKEGAIIAVNAEILDMSLVLKDYIKAKVVKFKEKKSKFKEVPGNLRVESITKSTVTLLWDAPEIDEKVFSYQVSARQASNALFNRNPESTYIVKKDAKHCERLGRWGKSTNSV